MKVPAFLIKRTSYTHILMEKTDQNINTTYIFTNTPPRSQKSAKISIYTKK